MSQSFDLIVIGSGSAAGAAASQCRAAGWRVAMIDKRPVGGTCALRGCDPKKVLVAAGAAVDAARALEGHGIHAGDLRIEWADLMRFKRTFTDPYPEKRRAGLLKQGIELFDGAARFVSPTAVGVDGETLEATRAILLAVGAVPQPLPIEGAEHVALSDDFLELPSLPGSVAFIGGGYISFEFAHVAARAGAKVTILHRGRRPLEQFDPDLVGRLEERTRALGIDIRLEAGVKGVQRTAAGYRVVADGPSGEIAVDTDLVVHGAGRAPDLHGLDLAAGEVDSVKRGVRVNEYLQSVSNPRVYAAGDCAATDGPPLTPIAGLEGKVVAANLLHPKSRAVQYPPVPSVVFTLPPLASVGLGEEEARRQGLRVTVNQGDTSGWYSSRRVREAHAGYKVLVEEGSGRLLGAHLLGPHADEVINLFALAMRAGIPADEFKQTIWAYPTNGSDVNYMV